MYDHIRVMAGVIVACLPLSATAQDMAGAVTLGLGSYDSSDGFADFTTRSLDGRLDLSYGNGLSLGATAASTRADYDGFDDHASVNSLGLTAGYALTPTWTAGLFYEYGEFSVDGFGAASMDSVGLFAAYDSALMGLEVFAGQTDGYDIAGAGVDWSDIGASLSFPVGSSGQIGAHLVRSHLSLGPDELDMVSAGLGGHYAFANGLLGFAGVTQASLEEFAGELTTMGVGLGYDLSTTMNLAAVASVELARTHVDFGTGTYDEDSIRIGLTLPLGRKAAAPLNSVAHSAATTNRTAITTALIAAY